MRSAVVVGVHAHAEPERLIETVRSLQAQRQDGTQIVLLPDGPDAAMSAALTADPALADLPRWGTAAPMGPAICFNRLASRSDAAVVVFVESGTVLAPGCLAMLVEALADPGRGLAGPSTNRSWNEQAVFRRAGARDLAWTAALARRRFGPAVRTLEPLHSLGDFCIAVSREVIEAIGGAEQAYGLGPCWEMDYNIRAARAGFQGVWVCAAYAFRYPPTARRQTSDRQQMDSARRLYQDRFAPFGSGGCVPTTRITAAATPASTLLPRPSSRCTGRSTKRRPTPRTLPDARSRPLRRLLRHPGRS